MTNYYHYENDRLTYINSNNSVGYRFTYDNFGRVVKNEVGNGTDHRTLSTMFYDKQLLVGQAYGNGDYINYSYDNLDRLTEIKYNDNENKKKTYVYGTDGNVSSVLDASSNTRTKYVYDLSGRLVETKEYSGTDPTSNLLISNTEYFYQDKTNYLTWMNHNSPLGNLAVAFGYGNIANGEMPDQVYSVWWNGTTHMSRSFDGLGRLSSSVINNVLTTSYSYKDVSAYQTTTQLQSMVTPAGTFTYTYDSLGNITSIFDGTYTLSYEYDSLNQLVRENDQKNNVTYTYEYLNGNILSKKQYVYTTGELGAVVNTINYGYGDNVWKDLLTEYNGNIITYDNIGNMTSFNGRTYSWLGRQLQSINGLATYTYNMDGQRIGKKTSNDDITYYYNGDILAGQKSGNTVTFFMYDENGDYFGFNYAGVNYYYIKNAQNDVIAIANSSGNVITSYTYDSWGKLISITGNYIIGYQNPIRYRSYYYDNESGMYYLQSRYYNPEIGRFINVDSVVSDVGSNVLGYNMFAYCFNNPINMEDPNGNWAVLEEFVNRVKYAVTTTFRIFTLPVTALEAKVGFGVGIGGEFSAKVKGISVSATAKKSCTDSLELKNRKVDLKSTTSEEVGFSVDTFSVGNSCGKEHSLFDKDCTCSFLDTPIVQRANCPANIEFTEESYTIGVSAGLYLGIGVEASIGINLETLFTEIEDIRNTKYISIY